MFRTVLAPPPDVGFDDVPAVEEGHFAVGFDPDLVSGVGRDWCIEWISISIHNQTIFLTSSSPIGPERFFVDLLNGLRIHILISSAVICSLNLPLCVNLPRHVPKDNRLCRATLQKLSANHQLRLILDDQYLVARFAR